MSLTVVVPTRNRAPFLGACLHSILASASEAERADGHRTEILVVDDASDDEGATRTAAEQVGARYLRLSSHDGVNDPGQAIVAGVEAVTTDAWCLFGDDDVMLVRHIRLALGRLEAGADVVSTSFHMVDETLRPTQTIVLPPADLGDMLADKWLVNDGSLVRREVAPASLLRPGLRGFILAPVWVQLMLDGRVFDVEPEPTWLYRRHSGNISRALPAEDRAIRAAELERLRALATERIGTIPPSPRLAQLAEQERTASEDAARDRRLLVRARRRAARAIEP